MKKALTLLLVMVMLLTVFTGCVETPSTEEQSDGTNASASEGAEADHVSEITVVDTEWEGVDVYQLTTAPHSHGLICDQILHREPDGTYTANIAEGYTISEDGKAITVTIPDDLQYYDGSYVTAEDLKRSIEWGQEISPYNFDYMAITSITVDGNDVTLHMDDGYCSTVLFYLASSFMPIIKAEDIDTMTEEELLWGATIYGAYYVDEYVAGDHVTLKPNPYYKSQNTHIENQGPCTIDTVTVRFMADEFAVTQGLLAGEIDIAQLLTDDSLAELASSDIVNVQSQPSDGIVRLMLNNNCELFEDERVRLAMMYIIDREEIAEQSNTATSPAYSLIPSIATGYDTEVEEYFMETYCNKPEEAEALLAEAGWEDTNNDGWLDKDGKIFEFTCIDFRDNLLTQELLQIQFQEYGIKMNIEMLERPAWNEAVQESDTYEAAFGSFYWSEGASTLPWIVNDKNILDGEEYYDLCTQAALTVDPADSTALLSQAQHILLDTTYTIPLTQPNRLFVFSDKVVDDIYYSYAMWRYWVNDIK